MDIINYNVINSQDKKGHKFEILKSRLLELSESKDWQEAKKEWFLFETYEADDREQSCACSHTPIVNVSLLKNYRTGNTEEVGCVCVKQFLDSDKPERIFNGIKRIRNDLEKSTTKEALHQAHIKNIITTWELDFYYDIMSKRKLSQKQLFFKTKINNKILTLVKKRS